jgi:hypothetical protein
MNVTKTIAGSESSVKGKEVFKDTIIFIGKNVENEKVNHFASSLRRYGVNTDANSFAIDRDLEKWDMMVMAGNSIYRPNEALEAALIGFQRDGKLTEEAFHNVLRDRFNPVMSHLEGAENVRKGNVRAYSLFD